MAKPRGLVRRDNVWCVRKDIPKELRLIIGVTARWVSLHTTDLREAIVRFHPVMARIEKEIEEARRKLSGQQPMEDEPVIIRPLGFDGRPLQMRRSTKASISLEAMFDKWVFEKKPKPNTEAEYRKASLKRGRKRATKRT